MLRPSIDRSITLFKSRSLVYEGELQGYLYPLGF